MGMFEAFVKMSEEQKEATYRKLVTANERLEAEMKEAAELEKAQGRKHVLTMKEKMDNVFNDGDPPPPKPAKGKLGRLVRLCMRIRDDPYFTLVVVTTILVVGFMNGVETDENLACKRLEMRERNWDDESNDDGSKEHLKDEMAFCDDPWVASLAIGYISQFIFTIEVMVKIGADLKKPSRYFTDEENGAWNCLDLFIVVVGFVELTPLAFLVEELPIVVFRLLRLLRVFRLAKAFPQLRSIVEALISGFGAVGWICVMIVIFNYIIACLCMLLFKKHDPFHWGSVG